MFLKRFGFFNRIPKVPKTILDISQKRKLI